MSLHFLHALIDVRKRVSTFLFGTRLTNVTRALRERAMRTTRWPMLGAGAGLGRAGLASPRRCTASPALVGAGVVKARSCILITDGLPRRRRDRGRDMERLRRRAVG